MKKKVGVSFSFCLMLALEAEEEGLMRRETGEVGRGGERGNARTIPMSFNIRSRCCSKYERSPGTCCPAGPPPLLLSSDADAAAPGRDVVDIVFSRPFETYC